MSLFVAASLLSANAGTVFWIAVVFFTFLFILSKFAWPTILGALKERETTIADSLTRAEKALAEAKQMQEDNERARRDAERQAQQILAAARDEEARIREREATALKEELARLQAQSREEIALEKQRAIGELRAEVAGLAIGAAEKILKENLDAPRQQKLVDAFIDGMPKN